MLSLKRPASLLYALLSGIFFFFFARSSSPFSAFVVNGSASRGKRVEMKQPKGSWTIPGRAGLSVWLQTLHCVTSSFISDFAVGLRGESAKILSLSLFLSHSLPLVPIYLRNLTSRFSTSLLSRVVLLLFLRSTFDILVSSVRKLRVLMHICCSNHQQPNNLR